ncbi:hypothetical protein BGW41_007895 [Actinomortierella wolfii]|nr:hypothetical protein BGW41_007895 [Actinomortierella wolfii]
MSYDYLLLAVTIFVPLGLFTLLRSEKGLPSPAADGATKVPGGFGTASNSKSKKKKNKKKNAAAAATSGATASTGGNKDGDDDGESDEGEDNDAKMNKKNDDSKATNNKAAVNTKEAKATGSSVSLGSTSTTPSNRKKNKKSQFAPVESVAELERRAAAISTSKTPDQLRFSAAAAAAVPAPSTTSTVSSITGVSVPGPGATSALGKGRKKGAGGHGSGLSHADFPTLEAAAKKKPDVSQTSKQPPKALHHDMLPATRSATIARIDQSDSEEEEQTKAQTNEDDVQDEEEEEEEEEEETEEKEQEETDEWQTVGKRSESPSTQSAPSAIDFNKPMDPWVAQQQRERLARIQEADPHGENTIKVARVLSIKPAAKEERYREPVPEGFQTQKSRSSTGSGSNSYSASNEPLTKKQRENLARAARKKEEKAAMDALQEQRRKEHLRRVEAERMKEFYRNQTRSRAAAAQAAPSKWGQGQQQRSASNSTVSGGMSAQLNEKGQLVWD